MSDEVGARAAAVQRAAAAAGWTYVGDGQPAAGAPAAMGYRISEMCAGLVNGQPFTVYDVLQVAPSDLNDPLGAGTIGDQQTVAQMGFPTAFRLTVIPPMPTGQAMFLSFGQRLHLESSEFEARYHAYCDDQVLGRIVLNPAVMADLLDMPFDVMLRVAQNLILLSSPRSLVPAEGMVSFVATVAKIRQSAISATSPETI